MPEFRPPLTALEWLRTRRCIRCFKCDPRDPGYHLVKTTCWCPQCSRVWKYRYFNIQDRIKKARRIWWYEDNPKQSFRLENK